jgi:4-alpha-glucanotransferase
VSRHAGLLIPLFSAPSTDSWGIGELDCLAPLAEWLASGGFDRLMLLPLGTIAADETSPYSAASAMAIDPLYIAVPAVPDFASAGGAEALSEAAQWYLADARSSSRVRYDSVRRVKREALDLAFSQFVREEWEQHTPRAASLGAYIGRERWWLDDYSLFQALSETYHSASWRDWPEPVRDRDPQALDEARRQLARSVLREQYLQWIAESQWQAARLAAGAAGVSVFGDLPFVVGAHSADVWAHADEFSLDVSLGVPPDAFNAGGQDWGLPIYHWGVMAQRDFDWIRQRARRMAALYSGFRVDHLVGFYRTFGRPAVGDPFFSPAGEDEQARQGEAILRIFLESGAAVIAEDLGTVPDFVRASMARLGVAGCKVLRWERAWSIPEHPFLEPAGYPAVSATLTSTHDTDPLAGWWAAAPADERAAMMRLAALGDLGLTDATQPWSDRLRDAMLAMAYQAGSNDVFVLVQDVFGWSDRINLPGTVSDANWTWRLPWPIGRARETAEAAARAAFCRALSQATFRGSWAPSTMPR